MSSLRRERVAEGIEVLRLDRPERRNAMDSGLLAELEAAMSSLASDASLRALVFSTTSTDALCAGADVGEQLSREAGQARMDAFNRFYDAVEAFPCPTIAVCVGHCMGAGAELAGGCDLRVGGDNLRMAWAGARLGVPVGPARLVPLVGVARAKELIFTGRGMYAEEAASLGLLHKLVSPGEAETEAIALAARVAEFPAAGLREMKQLFRELDDLPGRIAAENAFLQRFQTAGPGLPQGDGRE